MAQYLRPDSDVVRTNIASGTWASIDEVTASDADYVQTSTYGDLDLVRLEVSLTDPGLTPTSDNVTLRFRVRASDADRAVLCEVRQGSTVKGSYSTGILASGTITTFTQAIALSSVTDWNDLRLRFVFTTDTSGGSVRLYWAELEVADGFAGYTMTADGGSFTLTGGTVGLLAGRNLAADGGAFTLTGGDASFVKGKGLGAEGGGYAMTGGDVTFRITRVMQASGGAFTLTGGDADFRSDYYITAEGGTFTHSGNDVTFYIRERNGWNVPKLPAVSWSQSGGGSGTWTEIAPNDVDWTLQ